MDTNLQNGNVTSARWIRRRYWRTSLAFWLGLILSVEGSIFVATTLSLLITHKAPPSIVLMMGLMGAVSCLLGYTWFIYAIRRAFRRARVLLEGEPVIGFVTAIKEDKWVNYWDHSPAYLKYAFMDDFGTKQLGNSPYLVKNQDKRWQAGDPILVLVHREMPASHEVDVDDVRRSDFDELRKRLKL